MPVRGHEDRHPDLLTVVSGGQTGVDRAALDAALKCGLMTDGWCPLGRRAEDSLIPRIYPLRETPSKKYSQRTRWNVRDSDGTLILTESPPTGGTGLTIRHAQKVGRPLLIIDGLSDRKIGQTVDLIAEWINAESIRRLNVAGPRESTSPGIGEQSRMLLQSLFERYTKAGRE